MLYSMNVSESHSMSHIFRCNTVGPFQFGDTCTVVATVQGHAPRTAGLVLGQAPEGMLTEEYSEI